MHNFYSCLSPFLLSFPYFPRKSFILLALFYSLIKRSVFFTFLLLFQNTWKKCQERGFVRADSLKVLSSMTGKIELQDCSMLVTLHLQPGNIERFMNSDADAQHTLSAQHFVSVGLHSEFDFFPQICLSGNTLAVMLRNVS